MEYLKCVVLGPPVSGKTSLINTFMNGKYQGYIPHNVLTRYDVNFVVAGEEFSRNHCFKIYDYDIFKSNSQQFLKDDELINIDVIVLCFKNILDHRELLLTHFKTILRKRWPSVPVLLVSSFSDLMDKFSWMNELPDSDASTTTFAEKFGAYDHIFCSSLENFNISEIFARAFKLATNGPNEIVKTEEITKIYKSSEQSVLESTAYEENVRKLNISQRKIVKSNGQKMIESERKVHNAVSLTKLIIPLSVACALLLYLFTNRYCHQNQRHCNEIFELGVEVYDESITHLKDIYGNIITHYNKLNITK
jgi:GTPase SAR1 family protein